MLSLKDYNGFNMGIEKAIELNIELPIGKNQGELIADLKTEIEEIKTQFYGKSVFINGRLTTGMALFLGHYLAHISKRVYIFDPKENYYFLTVSH